MNTQCHVNICTRDAEPDIIHCNWHSKLYQAACQQQLEQWVEGRPRHNTLFDECCPDFSCCGSKLVEPEVRERYAKAVRDDDEETKMQMLMMFLGGMVPDGVHVAGSGS